MNRARGFAMLYAVIVVTVVVTLILGFTQFRSMVSHSTELTAQEINAQAAAEAGLIAALSELQANANFRTHERAQVTNETELANDPLASPKLQFTTALRFTSRLAAALPRYSGLAQTGTAPGEFAFEVGKGLSPAIGRGFDGQFRVKVAPVVLTGYPRPLIAVESRGRFDQRVTSLMTFLEAGGGHPPGNGGSPVQLNLQFPTFSSILTEFVIADGEFVDVGMGSPNDPLGENVFSVGRMYGAQAVHIANIEGSGTRQVFKRFGGFQSGGGVWLADPYEITFWDPTKPGEASAVFRGGGGERPNFQDPASDYFQASGGRIVDYRHGGKLALPDAAGALERVISDPSIPNVIDLSRVPAAGTGDDSEQYEGKAFIRPVANYQNPYGAIGESIEINFGRPAYMEGVTGDTDPIPYGNADNNPEVPPNHPARAAQPGNLLWCKGKNVILWGCPDRDVAIYTDKDIYVAGDFNQSPWHHQFYTSQDPANASAVQNDGREARYLDPVRFALDPGKEGGGNLDDLEASREGSSSNAVRLDQRANQNIFQERKLTRLTAKSRIWLDYRYPSRFLGNELMPWIEYQLAAHLLTDPAGAQAPTPAALSAAVSAVRYATPADVSKRDKALQTPVSGALFGFKDAAGAATPVAVHFLKEVLHLDPASTDATVKDAAGKAQAILLAELGAGPAAARIAPTADKLFHKVLCPFEKRTQAGGIWKMPEDYFEQAFVSAPADAKLYQHDGVFKTGGDPRLLRLYAPEMTVNAVMIDGATRNGDWDKANPHSDRKIYNEIGNAGATGTYLRFRDASGNRMTASPGIGRVYGSWSHLRQSPPDPNLFTAGAGSGPGAYIPLKRKRVYARSQGSFLGLNLRFGPGGDGGLANVFRVVSRREAVLSAERSSADALMANWP